MSRQINQPINQVRLTNVAVVRMNKGGKRFEIACYRNKVVDYRQGLEQDLSEVLQTDRVFTNVSKGEFAKAKDLQKIFGTKDEEAIAKLILQKGQTMQVSDKERSQQLEKTTAQIAEWISKNCTHPQTDRPYTILQIKHAMKHQAAFSVHPTKPLKRQYLDCVKLLQQVMPIQRAKMELLLIVPNDKDDIQQVEEILKENDVSFTPQQQPPADDAVVRYPILVDPSLYRILNDLLQSKIPSAKMEIVNQVVTKQGDYTLEEEHVVVSTADENDSTMVEDATAMMQQVRVDDDASEESDDDSAKEETSQPNSEDEDEDDRIQSATNRRKTQKKAKKKNQKAANRQFADASAVDEKRPLEESSTPSPSVSSQPVASNSATITTASNADDGRKSCNTCGGSFATPADFRAHFKSDWHRFNQKLKLKGGAPISEQEFVLVDAAEIGNVGKGGNGNDDILL